MEETSGRQRQVGREQLGDFLDDIFGGEVHAKRVESLADGVDGVLHAASLGVRAIGQGLAAAQGLAPKHAIKQVDRLLSNSKLDLEVLFACWVSFLVSGREEIVVNFDWTEYPSSDQSMVVLGMQTEHGRSTPLVWDRARGGQERGAQEGRRVGGPGRAHAGPAARPGHGAAAPGADDRLCARGPGAWPAAGATGAGAGSRGRRGGALRWRGRSAT